MKIEHIGVTLLVAVAVWVVCVFTLYGSCETRCKYGGLKVHAYTPFDGCICVGKADGNKFLMRPPHDHTPKPVLRAGEDYGK